MNTTTALKTLCAGSFVIIIELAIIAHELSTLILKLQ
jgi:hypothetical protein